MAEITVPQILRAPVISRVISRIRTPQQAFQRWLGVLPGGPNVNQVGGQYTGWDIFDNVRTIAPGRDFDSGPATIALDKIGHVQATMWRGHVKKHLQEAQVFRTRPLGGQWGQVDNRGERYVTRQEQTLAQQIYNAREFMISRMFRGLFYMRPSGDDFVLSDTSTNAVTVDYQVPSGNKGACIMLGPDGGFAIPNVTGIITNNKLFDTDTANSSWSVIASAPILLQMHLLNAAMEHQHGMPLRHVWLNSQTWVNVVNNTGLRNAAGSANTVWQDYRIAPGYADPGRPDRIVGNTAFDIVLRPLPWLTWHVYDGGLKVDNGSGTLAYTKFLPDGRAIFAPDPSPEWFELQEGSELVRENVVSQSTERFGIAAWTELTTQPSGFDMILVDNVLPALLIPKSVVYGTVVW